LAGFVEAAGLAVCSKCYRKIPMSKKKPVAIIAVAATAKPGHKCHSFTTFTHDFFVIVRAPSRILLD